MRRKLVIIGGGASAMMLASELDPKIFDVSLYEANKTIGRKFLVAGDGGLNLTHAESPNTFVNRYTPSNFIAKAFAVFNNQHLIEWLHRNGLQTIIGSSHRVFPEKGIKPITVQQSFLKKITNNKVKLFYEHELVDFDNKGNLVFRHKQVATNVKADKVVFCLGGASWPITGSKGNWLHLFEKQSVQTQAFEPSNCAYKINWPVNFIESYHGKVLKNCRFSCEQLNHFGEAVITKFGIEGSGVYPLSPAIRQQLKQHGMATLYVDFKPQLSVGEIQKRLFENKSINMSQRLKTVIKLNVAQINMLKFYLPKIEFLDPEKISKYLKYFPLSICNTAPLAEAISTVGGISLSEITEHFELKKIKNYFTIGEMLDYDAPTGGYLLQSCFTMGFYLAHKLNSLHK